MLTVALFKVDHCVVIVLEHAYNVRFSSLENVFASIIHFETQNTHCSNTLRLSQCGAAVFFRGENRFSLSIISFCFPWQINVQQILSS